jgi:hypothetical protein
MSSNTYNIHKNVTLNSIYILYNTFHSNLLVNTLTYISALLTFPTIQPWSSISFSQSIPSIFVIWACGHFIWNPECKENICVKIQSCLLYRFVRMHKACVKRKAQKLFKWKWCIMAVFNLKSFLLTQSYTILVHSPECDHHLLTFLII